MLEIGSKTRLLVGLIIIFVLTIPSPIWSKLNAATAHSDKYLIRPLNMAVGITIAG